MSEPRTLVTGAAGFFGSAIVRALALDGIRVLATDRVDASAFTPRADVPTEHVEYVARDVAREPLDDLVADATAVVHAAALTPADESDGETGDALLAVNLAPLAPLLRAIRTSAHCRRLLFVSSAGVFEQRQARVLAEDDADGGSSLYGAAKLAAELLVRRYGALYGIETASIRPTSLFGAGELPRSSRPLTTALARLVEHLRRGEPVSVRNEQARADWLSVDDAAEAVRLLCVAPALDGRSFNLSSGVTRPFADVTAAVVQVTGRSPDASASTIVDAGDDRAAVIANTRIVEAFGWGPKRTVEDGVRDLLAFLGPVESASARPSG